MTPAGPEVVMQHAAHHIKRFRREWGTGPTAIAAVGLTRQQQRPDARYPDTDQFWAYCAMAYLRTIGRES